MKVAFLTIKGGQKSRSDKIKSDIKHEIKMILRITRDKWRRSRIKRFVEFNKKCINFNNEKSIEHFEWMRWNGGLHS